MAKRGVCTCGHTEQEHDWDGEVGVADWCNAEECKCERFSDEDQIVLDFSDEESELDLDDIESDDGYVEAAYRF